MWVYIRNNEEKHVQNENINYIEAGVSLPLDFLYKLRYCKQSHQLILILKASTSFRIELSTATQMLLIIF